MFNSFLSSSAFTAWKAPALTLVSLFFCCEGNTTNSSFSSSAIICSPEKGDTSGSFEISGNSIGAFGSRLSVALALALTFTITSSFLSSRLVLASSLFFDCFSAILAAALASFNAFLRSAFAAFISFLEGEATTSSSWETLFSSVSLRIFTPLRFVFTLSSIAAVTTSKSRKRTLSSNRQIASRENFSVERRDISHIGVSTPSLKWIVPRSVIYMRNEYGIRTKEAIFFLLQIRDNNPVMKQKRAGANKLKEPLVIAKSAIRNFFTLFKNGRVLTTSSKQRENIKRPAIRPRIPYIKENRALFLLLAFAINISSRDT